MRSLRFSGYALLSFIAAVLIVGCSNDSASSAEHGPAAGPTSVVSVAATPAVWPTFATYDAMDYNRPGLHPPLNPKQVATIQAVLRRVKPCQRQLVQYSFGNGFRDLVMFFSVPPGEGSHVFGTADEVYIPRDGSEMPMSDNENAEQMEKQGIQWDIDHQPCPSPPK